MQKKKRNTGFGTNVDTGGMELDARLKSEIGERPSIEVRILEINAEGKLEELSCYPLSYYGSCPNVGDTIVDSTIGEPCFYSIQRRYFVQETIVFAGWALIVRKIDPAGPPLELWQEWQDATRFWDNVAKQRAEELSRSIERELQAALERSATKKPPSQPKPKNRRKRVLKPRQPSGNNS
jgi:hypothetical protein